MSLEHTHRKTEETAEHIYRVTPESKQWSGVVVRESLTGLVSQVTGIMIVLVVWRRVLVWH